MIFFSSLSSWYSPSLSSLYIASSLLTENGTSIIIVPLLIKSETLVQAIAVYRLLLSVVEYLSRLYSKLTPGKLSQELTIVKESSPTKYLK